MRNVLELSWPSIRKAPDMLPHKGAAADGLRSNILFYMYGKEKEYCVVRFSVC
jgi:hypothetical protein